jgi:hypothetical protein
MKEQTKTIGISALIALSIVTASMVVPGLFDEPHHYCESRPELGFVTCDSFSKYVDINGKCIRDDNTNLICRDGWKLVVDDTELEEKTLKDSNTNNIEYDCNPNGCEVIQ